MDFRLDRIVTLYLARPLQTSSNGPRQGIPILMYHSIADKEEGGIRAYYRTATHPLVFILQMGILRNEGYSVLLLKDAVAQLERGVVSGKYAVITFDDGFRNIYSSAFPILKEYAFPATVFLPSAFIGDSSRRFHDEDCLSWGEVRE